MTEKSFKLIINLFEGHLNSLKDAERLARWFIAVMGAILPAWTALIAFTFAYQSLFVSNITSILFAMTLPFMGASVISSIWVHLHRYNKDVLKDLEIFKKSKDISLENFLEEIEKEGDEKILLKYYQIIKESENLTNRKFSKIYLAAILTSITIGIFCSACFLLIFDNGVLEFFKQ